MVAGSSSALYVSKWPIYRHLIGAAPPVQRARELPAYRDWPTAMWFRQAEGMLTNIIPKVFYTDIAVGLDLFVDGIGMQVLHRDDGFVVAGRDQIKVHLVEDAVYAAKDRPELSIETDDIEAVYADVFLRRPDLLHPNLDHITRQPWGPREFALLDETTVCVIFREWPV